jgi:surface antigen/peptidoglycan hydrolase CwlO-like protein
MQIKKRPPKVLSNRIKAGFMAGLFALTFSLGAVAFADTYDDKINELRNQNSQNQNALGELSAQEVTFQATINQLASQIAALQAEIRTSQSEQARIEAEIVANQQLIDKKKTAIGASIKAMYLDGAITTIEQLATSKSLSEYIDKEEYRSAVQSKLSDTINEINALQAKLVEQKAAVELLIKRQQEQNQQLASDQAEQARLLTYNQEQQNQFTAQIQSNNDNITKLKQAQAAELARRYGSSGGIAGGGGYPWGNAYCIHTGSTAGPCPNYDWAINGNIYNFSNGGYGYRNCTDWVAWRAGAPAGLGNANTWAARSKNVSLTPKQGDAAVDEYGTYGHVMYVEGVYDGGATISVSDYNRTGDGLYRVTSLTKVGEGYYRSPAGYVNYLKFVTFD